MRKFSVTDLTTGTVTQTNGVQAPTNGILMSQIDYQTSADDLSIVGRTSNVCILTGSGNDTIDVSATTGPAAITAGSGMNFIRGGVANMTITATGSLAPTVDTIAGFHSGDCVTLNGAFALAWADTPGVGVTVTATETGMAPVHLVFHGLSQASLMTSIGHGGASTNILAHALV
jgi:hypothetical protein